MPDTPLQMSTVVSTYTHCAKARLLSVLTAMLFVSAMVTQCFAIAPVETHVKHCRMQMMDKMRQMADKSGHDHDRTGHRCQHQQQPVMPCCPPPAQNNTPADCMTRGECCQISEDRSRPLRRDALTRATQSDEVPTAAVATAPKESSSAQNPIWVEASLRHTRAVFDLKTDLRI